MNALNTTTSARINFSHAPQGVESIWHEFRRQRQSRADTPGIRARATLTQPERDQQQFVMETGSGHHLIVDSLGVTGSRAIELLAAALAASLASQVIARIRAHKDQFITGYEVRIEAAQTERAPRALTSVHIHHVINGRSIDAAVINDAIRSVEENNCPVEALLKHTASIMTTFEIVEEPTE
jgi:uncharacterized OsmC-like protein